MTDSLRSCRRGWNIHSFTAHNFNWRVMNAPYLKNICAKTDDRKQQWFSTCENIHKRSDYNENLLKKSLLVMINWLAVMTLKPNSSPHTWRALLYLTTRKYNRYTHEWNQCIMTLLQKFRHLRFLSADICRMWRKQPEIWTARSWLLQHDNAPAYTALSIRPFLAKHSIRTLSQPLPSQLSSIPFKGRRFQTVEDMQWMTWKQ
jgi:hypothetical protein